MIITYLSSIKGEGYLIIELFAMFLKLQILYSYPHPSKFYINLDGMDIANQSIIKN
jgi:hypothetical protein